MQLTKILILLLFIFGISSCIEPFMPETAKHEYTLFIEGLITNDPDIPPSVKISGSVPILTEDGESFNFIPTYIGGADIYILCDDGTEYKLSSWGLYYKSMNPAFTGEIGKSYKVIIYYLDDVFESEFIKLRESPPIDSLSYKVVEKKNLFSGSTNKGYNFLVSTHEDSPGPSYYRWQVDATFYYSVPLFADYIWDGRNLIEGNNWDVKYCWKSKNIPGIFTSDTEGLMENSIIEAPLNFESQYGDELSDIYSLHVKQLTISRESYSFWKDLDKLINESGGLYETQPFGLSGNIKCTSNPNISVAGIFEVAGVSEGREFFNRPEEFPIIRYSCFMDTVGTENYPWDMVPPGTYIIHDEVANAYLTSSIYCFDCTARRGTTIKPAFWEY